MSDLSRDQLRKTTSPVRRAVIGAITIALIAIAFFGLLPALADYNEAWAAVKGVSILWLVVLVVFSVLNQMAGPLPTMAVIPHLRFRHALAARLASTTAANTIPGGGAVGVGLTYMMLGRWGHTGAEVGAAAALTGIWNNLARMLLPAFALIAASLNGIEMESLVDGALIGVVALVVAALLIVVILRSALRDRVLRPIDRFIGWIAHLAGKGPFHSSPSRHFLGILSDAVGTRWQRLMATTLLYHLSLYACLLATLRAVGIHPQQLHWAEVLAAFSLVRLVSAIPITPGALGVIEVGLVGLLSTGLGTHETELVAGGVLLFRFLTYALPTLVGAIVAGVWSRSRNRDVPGRWGDYPAHHFEDAVCFRCGVPGRLRWRLDQFALVECPQCGQAFMSPRLNHDGRLALYGDAEYFDAGVYKTERAKGLQRRWSEGRLDLIERSLGDVDNPSLYEVGCAYGMFLEAARDRGFRVSGLEFSPVAARTAAERLGTDIHTGEITDLDDADNDVVAFWDVIEHVPDPAAFLAAAVRLTRPGGIIAFSCPRFDSLAARVFRTNWWTLKPHKHIWHFTRADLRRLLDDHDLEEVALQWSPLRRGNLARFDSLVVVARKPLNT